jgi:hypothetical protein
MGVIFGGFDLHREFDGSSIIRDSAKENERLGINTLIGPSPQ